MAFTVRFTVTLVTVPERVNVVVVRVVLVQSALASSSTGFAKTALDRAAAEAIAEMRIVTRIKV